LRRSNYDKFPVVQVAGHDHACVIDWIPIIDRLRSTGATLIVVETYPGVRIDDVMPVLAGGLQADQVVLASQMLKQPDEIARLISGDLTDDPVFGKLTKLEIEDFIDANRRRSMMRNIELQHEKLTLVIGVGASLLVDRPHLLVYADLARWEIQIRQRRKGHRSPLRGLAGPPLKSPIEYTAIYS
jgi:hypothetical protein